MSNKNIITDILLVIRKKVLQLPNNDREVFKDYFFLLDTLSDVTSEVGDRSLATIIQYMADATYDLWNGDEWRNERMPSEEDIQKATEYLAD